MQVEIYIETDAKTMKTGKMHYAAIVVAKARAGDQERRVVNFEETSTYHRAMLQAALAGMELLNRPCEVKVFTKDAWLVNNINAGNVEKWKRSEWRRAQNKELKNKDLWELLELQMSKHTVTFVHTEESGYFDKLKALIGKEKEQCLINSEN